MNATLNQRAYSSSALLVMSALALHLSVNAADTQLAKQPISINVSTPPNSPDSTATRITINTNLIFRRPATSTNHQAIASYQAQGWSEHEAKILARNDIQSEPQIEHKPTTDLVIHARQAALSNLATNLQPGMSLVTITNLFGPPTRKAMATNPPTTQPLPDYVLTGGKTVLTYSPFSRTSMPVIGTEYKFRNLRMYFDEQGQLKKWLWAPINVN